ncbi:MAG TPA: bacillithiol biosynthesis BshC, partial [Acidobacteriaceae bacterium]|nr:bacillithiol biosynthesis BshC [Acidobacteriaceae bacterium]
MNQTLSADCYPVTLLPEMSRFYLDYCSGNDRLLAFNASLPRDGAWQHRPQIPAHWPKLVRLLREQNPSPEAAPALEILAQGGGAVVTGQQVALFGGPLFTPFKMATAVARAQQASRLGHAHAAVFWLASGDHDFAEIDHVVFPAGRELAKLVYAHAPETSMPVGRIVLDGSILPLVDRARELLGPSEATEALARAYPPGKTFAQAFAEFYTPLFGAQGLLVLDVNAEGSARDLHRMGGPVLRAAIERADELHQALLERNQALEAAGYHAQVAVLPQSSLLFLIDERTGARQTLKRTAPGATEPGGLWQAGKQNYSTNDLLGILDAEPERISPAALLRPVFQDFLLSSSLIIGGPAELAYFAQSAVLYERILGRQTPAAPRFSATLIEPSIAELMRRHEL